MIETPDAVVIRRTEKKRIAVACCNLKPSLKTSEREVVAIGIGRNITTKELGNRAGVPRQLI